ncbi:MAG TPA: GAF domain-containing protein [Anaerolineae bacterium]|nr:GAF domain-containing protein [Anaerolineae bacterium]HQI86977.1 GAF domain-containing protein [Anaerolineae bacterium]
MTDQTIAQSHNSTTAKNVKDEAQHLALIYEIGRYITSTPDVYERLPEIGWLIGEGLRLYNVEIALAQDEELVFYAGHGGYTDQTFAPGTRMRISDGIMGKVAATGKTLLASDVRESPDYQYYDRLPDTRSEIAVPLQSNGVTYGVLDAKSDRLNGFDAQSTATLETLASQIAAALESTHLYRSTLSANDQFAALHWAGQAIINTGMESERIYTAIHTATIRLMHAEAFVIALLDEEQKGIDVVYLVDRGQRYPAEHIPLGQGISGHVIATGEPLFIPDLTQSESFAPRHFGTSASVCSVLAVPLRLGDKILGMLSAQSYRRRAHTLAHQHLLETLAAYASIAIENARLFKAAQDRSAELEAVRQASLHVTSSLELDDVLQAILDNVLKLVPADDAIIFLYNTERLGFGAAQWRPKTQPQPTQEPREHGITYTVARSGEKLVVPNMAEHPLFAGTTWSGAIASLPLKIRQQVVGVMNIAFHHPHDFNPNELRALELLGDQAAIAIRNAELFEAAQRRLQELTVVYAVATAGVESTGEDELIERATDLIGATLYPDNFGILLRQDDALHIHRSYRGIERERQSQPIRLGQGITGLTAQDGQPRRIADIRQCPDAIIFLPDMRAELCVPLKIGERIIGVINAESKRENAYTPNDERLLLTFAHQLTTAIEKLRLFAQVQDRATELAAALERLQELDQLKNVFIQNTSHELRTPLAIIRGYIDLLQTGDLGALNPPQADSINIIARRTVMLSTMVEDLTAILETEAQRLQRVPVDLVQLVKIALEDFRIVTAQARLTLNAAITAETIIILGDSLKLRRVLDNLIGNALKFTEAGGEITIRLWADTEHAFVEVADTGIGIPADKIDHIFERFYQVDGSLKRRYGGTGLGLALVKEIVEAHNGQVSVQSVLGRGSTFRITLPCLPAAN